MCLEAHAIEADLFGRPNKFTRLPIVLKTDNTTAQAR